MTFDLPPKTINILYDNVTQCKDTMKQKKQ